MLLMEYPILTVSICVCVCVCMCAGICMRVCTCVSACVRGPFLGVCILRTTTCKPFYVDQLNPAGFNVFNVTYKENSRFFPARETGNLKINMAEADLSLTTFTFS